MEKDFYAKRCNCGAVTVEIDGDYISMPYKEFREKYPNAKLEKGKSYNCNYCVNHWGTDLCECGSGDPVGECNCGSKKSSARNGRNKGFIIAKPMV